MVRGIRNLNIDNNKKQTIVPEIIQNSSDKWFIDL